MNKLLVIIFIFCITFSVYADNKYALLIANSKYKSFSSLDGPIKEARDLSSALQSLGFTVDLLENGNREQMLDKLDSIKQKINGKGGTALFHYGGHGVQAQGSNFLIPVDADIPDEKKLSTRSVDIDEVMSSLDSCGSDTNIVILDACRNNPLPAGASRSATRGLTVVGIKPKNSIIVYSAEAGTVAQDGLFTPTLTKLITQSGKSLNQILMQLRREVSQKSNGVQIPGEYNQLFDDIYLNGVNAPNNTVSIQKQGETNPVIKQFSSVVDDLQYKKLLFYTNFIDDNANQLQLLTGQKVEPKSNSLLVYGTTPVGGGAMIGLPISLKLGSRAIVEFRALDNYEFGFSLCEDMNNQKKVNSYLLSQVNGNFQGEEYPWKYANGKWNTTGRNIPLFRTEFRYVNNENYLLIVEILQNGSSSIKLINSKGKVVEVNCPFKFRDIPITFFIRNFKGTAEYSSLTVQEF